MVFFFFQAEDGIRDKLVTGVQTCALPIFEPRRVEPREHRHARELRRFLVNAHVGGPPSPSSTTARSRGLWWNVCREYGNARGPGSRSRRTGAREGLIKLRGRDGGFPGMMTRRKAEPIVPPIGRRLPTKSAPTR